jgi:hypothetical protein
VIAVANDLLKPKVALRPHTTSARLIMIPKRGLRSPSPAAWFLMPTIRLPGSSIRIAVARTCVKTRTPLRPHASATGSLTPDVCVRSPSPAIRRVKPNLKLPGSPIRIAVAIDGLKTKAAVRPHDARARTTLMSSGSMRSPSPALPSMTPT